MKLKTTIAAFFIAFVSCNEQQVDIKVVTVWRKQADGSWKNVVDLWNADPSHKK